MTDLTNPPPYIAPDGFRRALAALYSAEPVTDAERAGHELLVALQAARDDAKRAAGSAGPLPTLDKPNPSV